MKLNIRKRRHKSQNIGEFQIKGQRKYRQRVWKQVTIRRIIMLILCATTLLSITMIVSIIGRSIRTKQLNDSLSMRRSELVDTALLTVAPETAEESLNYVQEDAALAPEAAVISLENTPAPRRVYHKIGGTALPYMEELYYENRDLIGWIEIPGVLDLPVMYKDNSYYLTRDFNKNKNASGTLFLDENHRFTEYTQNLLIHGHNMKDGSMFGRLVQYLNSVEYLKRNAFIHYDTLWDSEQYVIFAVLLVSLDVREERFFNYFTHPIFETDAEFEHYVRQAQLRSEYAIPLNVEPGDALLTLSTCIDDDRLVILCRRLREGERRSQIQQNINLAVKQ